MLELLRIRDLALIEDAAMEFSPGMNVLTGETGAGKSFILKALNFLTGEKMDTEMVRPGKEKAAVEAVFYIDGEECIIRRELIAATGRSRFYVNDALSSQESIRRMRPSLVLHTSQHGQQKLLQPAYQAKILDDFMNRPDLLEERSTLLRKLQLCIAERNDLEEKIRGLEEKREVLEYQQGEIAQVAPQPGEEEELETLRSNIRNQAGISENALAALGVLHGNQDGPGIYASLATLEKHVLSLSKLLEHFTDTPGLLLEIRLQLQELENALGKAAKHATDTADLEAIESRLYALAQLKRKLKRPLAAIIRLHEEIAHNLNFLDSCALRKKELAAEEQEACDALADLLARLNAARREAADKLSVLLQQELAGLGFSEHVRTIFAFTESPLHPERKDCTELTPRLLWQPNPGQPEQPLDRIASGGELSRFLLALVTLMSRTTEETPTLIFDEVDAGVGGLTLNKVAQSLEHLASARQMLLITHWPQLAKSAERHFVITKEVADGQTYTRCSRLTDDAIAHELARMAGGGEQGMALSRELLSDR